MSVKTENYLLKRYLPRIDFTSYADFYNNYRVTIPDGFNFAFDIVDEWAAYDADKPALVWCDDHGGERRFTFMDISRESNRAANYLSGLGVKKGDVVLCILRQRYEYWIIATALCKLGAVVIPAVSQLTAKDIAYRANAAGVSAVICVNDESVAGQVMRAKDDCATVKQCLITPGEREGFISFENEVKTFPDTFARPVGSGETRNNDTMLIYFTSGTTGMPKMARHDFTHPLGHIVTAKYWQRVTDGGLHFSYSDSGWAKFGWGKIYGQWICGAAVFAYDWDRFVAARLLDKIEKYKITTFCCPPTMYRFMLLEDLSKYDLGSITNCANAGEPLNPEVYSEWLKHTGHRLKEGFGLTESTVLVANYPWFDEKPGSMGKPSPLYNVELVDAEGNACADGEEGEIVVTNLDASRPCGLFCGYVDNDEANAEAFYDGAYHTGDVAWRDADGCYWFVGRMDDVIKCSGYRIGPFEVESALIEHPAVVECAVTAAPDALRGQIVKATVVLKEGRDPSDDLILELQEHVKRVTAPYKYPRVIEFVKELPKTASGKIKRGEIREKDKESTHN